MELPRSHCLYPTVQCLRALGTEKGGCALTPESVLGLLRGKSCAKRDVPFPGSSTQSLERGWHQQCAGYIHMYIHTCLVCVQHCASVSVSLAVCISVWDSVCDSLCEARYTRFVSPSMIVCVCLCDLKVKSAFIFISLFIFGCDGSLLLLAG